MAEEKPEAAKRELKKRGDQMQNDVHEIGGSSPSSNQASEYSIPYKSQALPQVLSKLVKSTNVLTIPPPPRMAIPDNPGGLGVVSVGYQGLVKPKALGQGHLQGLGKNFPRIQRNFKVYQIPRPKERQDGIYIDMQENFNSSLLCKKACGVIQSNFSAEQNYNNMTKALTKV
ncbi:hypothetical protein B0H16DRAFT_1485630 [Mycena metata]|uniref:Uncharacterized protein n=1 Tax=Mycena metata TaxID=1033252 RepID=A0AAD7DNX5_9AGAR|nr:hypothetical protein B0H16DRAFT_1485630 [Mycena metata]